MPDQPSPLERTWMAAALLDAVDRLATYASISVGLAGDVYMATCGDLEAFGPTPAAALVALADQLPPLVDRFPQPQA